MMGCPPKRSLLHRRASQNCAQELEPTRCLESAMQRNIDDRRPSHRKLVSDTRTPRSTNAARAKAYPETPKAAHVHEHERGEPKKIGPFATRNAQRLAQTVLVCPCGIAGRGNHRFIAQRKVISSILQRPANMVLSLSWRNAKILSKSGRTKRAWTSLPPMTS